MVVGKFIIKIILNDYNIKFYFNKYIKNIAFPLLPAISHLPVLLLSWEADLSEEASPLCI